MNWSAVRYWWPFQELSPHHTIHFGLVAAAFCTADDDLLVLAAVPVDFQWYSFLLVVALVHCQPLRETSVNKVQLVIDIVLLLIEMDRMNCGVLFARARRWECAVFINQISVKTWTFRAVGLRMYANESFNLYTERESEREREREPVSLPAVGNRRCRGRCCCCFTCLTVRTFIIIFACSIQLILQ